MISEVLIVLLIGEYTEFPAWLPADPGSGIALFNSTEGAEPFANTVLSVHNPSFLCADGYGGFYVLAKHKDGSCLALQMLLVQQNKNFCRLE